MNRKTVNAVIILGIISLASILFIQIFWIRKTLQAQQVNIEIQEKEDSLNLKQFSEHAHIALRNVLEEINHNAADRMDLYGAVKQIRTNYFSVDIAEELHPFYLEQLLKRMQFFGDINRKIIGADLFYSTVKVHSVCRIVIDLFQYIAQRNMSVFRKLLEVKAVFFFLDFDIYLLCLQGFPDPENLNEQNTRQ